MAIYQDKPDPNTVEHHHDGEGIQCPFCGAPDMGFQEFQAVSYTVVHRKKGKFIIEAASVQDPSETSTCPVLYCTCCDREVPLESGDYEFD